MRTWALWAVLLAGLLAAVVADRPPRPRAADAPSDRFSAARALVDVRAIAQAPHPTGSAEIARVRGYLLDRLSGLGLSPETHAGEGLFTPRWAPETVSAAAVQNLVGVLPGRDRRAPALLVMAHYDTVSNSPGAADDTAGVATVLEIARSLAADARSGRPPARDVVFLLTDGEEAGLLGAQAFFAADPLAGHVGAVINLEARGDAGRAAMFQTGPADGAMIALYGHAAERPFANAFTGLVASLLPNDTDFTLARGKRLPGLNFAFIGDQLAYHTPLATPAHLDPGSLQSLGGQALPVARALADAPALPPARADAAYADLFGLTLVRYPAALGWALVLASFGLLAFALVRARRAGLTPAPDLARGVGVTLLAALAPAAALHLLGRLTAAAPGGLYGLLVRFDLLELSCAAIAIGLALLVYVAAARGQGRRIAAVALLAVGASAGLIGREVVGPGLGVVAAGLAWACLARPTGVWSAWLGAVAVGAALTLALQLAAPPAALLAAWPALLAALASAVVFGTSAREAAARRALAAAGALAALSVALVSGWALGVFTALGATTPEALALFVLLATPAVAPFARLWAGQPRSVWTAGGLLAAGTLGVLLVALLGGTAQRPRLTRAFYLAEPARGLAWRVADGPGLDAWTRAVLGPHVQHGPLPPSLLHPAWTAPTRPAPAQAPAVSVAHEADRLIVTVRPSGPARELEIRLRPSAGLADARLNARPIPWRAGAGAWSSARYEAPPPEGVTLSFAAPPSGRVEIVATEVYDGWPAGQAIPEKPAGLMAAPGSDTSRLVARADVGW